MATRGVSRVRISTYIKKKKAIQHVSRTRIVIDRHRLASTASLCMAKEERDTDLVHGSVSDRRAAIGNKRVSGKIKHSIL